MDDDKKEREIEDIQIDEQAEKIIDDIRNDFHSYKEMRKHVDHFKKLADNELQLFINEVFQGPLAYTKDEILKNVKRENFKGIIQSIIATVIVALLSFILTINVTKWTTAREFNVLQQNIIEQTNMIDKQNREQLANMNEILLIYKNLNLDVPSAENFEEMLSRSNGFNDIKGAIADIEILDKTQLDTQQYLEVMSLLSANFSKYNNYKMFSNVALFYKVEILETNSPVKYDNVLLAFKKLRLDTDVYNKKLLETWGQELLSLHQNAITILQNKENHSIKILNSDKYFDKYKIENDRTDYKTFTYTDLNENDMLSDLINAHKTSLLRIENFIDFNRE